MFPYQRQLHQQVDLWTLTLEQDSYEVERLAEFLSPDEHTRAARFHFERDRVRFTVGRGILRQILSTYLNCEPAWVSLVYGAHGKPEVHRAAHPNAPHFNLSHSQTLGTLAVTDIGAVGVDVEYMRDLRDMQQVAERVFSGWEYARWAALPPSHRRVAFYRGWTCKEAYMKAVGEGFYLPTTHFDIAFLPNEPARLVCVYDERLAGNWQTETFSPEANFAGAFVIAGGANTTAYNIYCYAYDPQGIGMAA